MTRRQTTEHPTATWTEQQIVEAFPWDTAPRYLLRDRDSIYDVFFDPTWTITTVGGPTGL